MPRQNQRGTLTDLQVLGSDRDTLSDDGLHLLVKVLEIESHAVAQDIDNALSENARGKQMEGKFAVLVDYRVTGIAAALIADHVVKTLGQKVDHTALSFIAPVDTNNRAITHSDNLSFCEFG